jgi:hypothetical protein
VSALGHKAAGRPNGESLSDARVHAIAKWWLIYFTESTGAARTDCTEAIGAASAD